MPVGPSGVYGAQARVASPASDAGLGFGVSAGAEVSLSQDGTPSRIAGILILSGGVLALLRMSGFRFNVGVSS